MAHKTKDKPRKLYARQGVPFICFASAGAPYWAPELRADSEIKLENGPVIVIEHTETEGEGENAKEVTVGLSMTQGDVTERCSPFTYEVKQRGAKAEAEASEANTDAAPDSQAA